MNTEIWPVLAESDPRNLEEATISPFMWQRMVTEVRGMQTITPDAFRNLCTPDSPEQGGGITHFDGTPMSAIEVKAAFEQMRANGMIALHPTEGTDSYEVEQYDIIKKPKDIPEPIESLEIRTRGERASLIAHRLGRRAVSSAVQLTYHDNPAVKLAKFVGGAPGRHKDARDKAAAAQVAAQASQKAAQKRDDWSATQRTTKLNFAFEPGELEAIERVKLEHVMGNMGRGTQRGNSLASRVVRAAAEADPERARYKYVDSDVLESLDSSMRSMFETSNVIRLAHDVIDRVRNGEDEEGAKRSVVEAATDDPAARNVLEGAVNGAVNAIRSGGARPPRSGGGSRRPDGGRDDDRGPRTRGGDRGDRRGSPAPTPDTDPGDGSDSSSDPDTDPGSTTNPTRGSRTPRPAPRGGATRTDGDRSGNRGGRGRGPRPPRSGDGPRGRGGRPSAPSS